MDFTMDVTNIHGPSHQATACRSPTCSIQIDSNVEVKVSSALKLMFFVIAKKSPNICAILRKKICRTEL